MASVEVVKGLGSETFHVKKKPLAVLSSLFTRQRTVSTPSPHFRSKSEDNDTERMLGFTSYRKPPTSVPREGVLIQVWCVGVDEVDARLLGLRVGTTRSLIPMSMSRKSTMAPGKLMRTLSIRSTISARGEKVEATHTAEVGFVPGRSFAGRVLECGWDVKDEVLRKGDWVVGLLDRKKVLDVSAILSFLYVEHVFTVWRSPRIYNSRQTPSSSHPSSYNVSFWLE
jgi:hypothetical protein